MLVQFISIAKKREEKKQTQLMYMHSYRSHRQHQGIEEEKCHIYS
jgi:hypothetical protein